MIYAAAVVLFWGTVATAFKIALSEISYIKLVLIASFTATLVFGVNIIISGKIQAVSQIFAHPRRLLKYGLLGAMNPLLYYLVLFKAYSLLPAQVAQPLNYSWQILLVLLSVPLLGATVRRGQVLWLLVSFVGIILISTQGSIDGLRTGSTSGVLLALFSAFIWAFYWIFNSRQDDSVDTGVRLFLNFIFGTLYLIIYCAFFDNFDIPSTRALLSAVYVGLFEMGITFLFWAKALSLATNKPSVIGLTYLSPVISIILIHFILGETIFTTTILGFALIIAGIHFSNRSGK